MISLGFPVSKRTFSSVSTASILKTIQSALKYKNTVSISNSLSILCIRLTTGSVALESKVLYTAIVCGD